MRLSGEPNKMLFEPHRHYFLFLKRNKVLNYKLETVLSRSSTVRPDLLLLLTAVIWGFAFVAQRMGMEHIGPFLFNGIRFGLGAGVMLLALKAREWQEGRRGDKETRGRGDKETRGLGDLPTADCRLLTARGVLLGLILFAGASFQQMGMVYTTAGNAGFITGLYVILVPVLGLFAGNKTGVNLWAGAVLGVIGLYFLSITSALSMSRGDILVMVSALFWAMHVLYTGWLSPRHSALKLALVQYSVVSALSFITAFFFEENTFDGVRMALWPILYGGILSVGIAYTLQIVGQKKAPPTHAAIIMSLEAVFAVIGGMVVLSETMSGRQWMGCAFMLCGMLLAQLPTAN
jgi:drug/metabolite transporter (DMT)-like permease